MKQGGWIAVGLGFYAASILHARSVKAMQKKTPRPGQNVLLASLLAPFRSKIAILVQDMENQGFPTIIANSARTPAQAHQYQLEGKGIDESMHTLDAAVDLAHRLTGWNDPDPSTPINDFHEALGKSAKKLGLTWGGDWKGKKYDPGHVQALPVAAQKQFRLLSVPQRIAYLERLYKW